MLKLGTQNIAALHLGGEQIKRAYIGEAVVFGAGKPSRLPGGYTEVEYIQSDGSQRIDTQIKPTNTIKISMDTEPISVPTHNASIFWSYLKYGAAYYYCTLTYFGAITNPSISGYLGVYSQPSATSVQSGINLDRTVVSCDAANKTMSVGSSSAKFSNNRMAENMPNLVLLGDSVGNGIPAKLYSCQIEIGGDQIRDFVPCIDPSGAVGLYDLVGSRFYGNAGTGTFTAGPAVALEDNQKERRK